MSAQRRHGQSIRYVVILCYLAGPLQRCGIWGCHVGHGQGPLAKLLVTLPAFRPAAAPQDGKVPIKLQTFSTSVTCCHTLSPTEKIREGPRKSSWLGMKAGDFHTFSYTFMASERWLKKDKAAVCCCARLRPTHL